MKYFIPPYNIVNSLVDVKSQLIDYWHKILKVQEAHLDNKGEKAVIYVLDTAEKWLSNDISNEGNSYAYNGTGRTGDAGSHGHYVASMCGALNNEIGTLGVAPESLVIPVKGLHINSGLNQWIIKCLDYIINNYTENFKSKKVGIINMSFGSNSPDPELKAKLEQCKQSGLILVAAAGNDGGNVNYPAAWEDLCISVPALDRNNQPPRWTSRGESADVSAHGVSVLAVAPNSIIQRVSGTSFASPIVAGICAIIGTKYIDLFSQGNSTNHTIMENHLLKYATDILEPGHDEFGAGMAVISPYLDNAPDGTEPPDEEPDYPDKEERELVFIFDNTDNLNMRWGTSISLELKLVSAEALAASYSTMYVDRMEIKMTTDKYAEEQDTTLSRAVKDYFTNRGLVLFENSDINDAAYWTLYFMKMFLGRKDLSFDVISMEVSDSQGTKIKHK